LHVPATSTSPSFPVAVAASISAAPIAAVVVPMSFFTVIAPSEVADPMPGCRRRGPGNNGTLVVDVVPL
jgi:hypothetical protein